MSDLTNYRRLSLAQAAERAITLAKKFLEFHHSSPTGGKWEILGANQIKAAKSVARKVGPDWSVVVTWTCQGSTSDGPSVIIVNLETSDVRFL